MIKKFIMDISGERREKEETVSSKEHFGDINQFKVVDIKLLVQTRR